MPPARGDTKPCIRTDCTGTMQFAREPGRLAVDPREPDHHPLPGASDGDRGWVCSAEPQHFQRG
jgi:hypothetical protein